MKYIVFILLSALFSIQTVYARTVEVDVYGMTCAFCVDSLERKFSEIKSVIKVDVSLKHKKIRLETDEEKPSVAVIKQTVLDAGFTPTKITVLSNDKESN